VFEHRKPCTVLVRVDSLHIVLGVTSLGAHQCLVDADEILRIVCVEAVDDLHHICIGDIAGRPVHVMIEKPLPVDLK